MTLAELLEEDREKLLRDLAASEDPERCEDVLERELDRLLYRYNGQSRDEAERGMAAVLLTEAKMLLPLLTAGSSTRLWESTQLQDEKAGEKKARGGRTRTIARILLAAGCAAGLLLLLLFPARDAAGYGRTGAEAVLLLAGVLLFYLSGRLSAKAGAKGQEKLQRVEVIADPDAVCRTLRNMLYFADQSIQEARGSAGSAEPTPRISSSIEEPGSTGEDRDLPREELDLLSGILEAGESGDGAYALEQADRVRYYLHTKGYETQQFEEGREAMFELMPGDRDVTISPAITKGEKLVKRGKAAHRS